MIYTFDSTQSGAPVLSGTSGALAALLKACLVDGFGAGAVSSLVVTGGVAKLTYAGVHPLKLGSVARIAGATPSGLNGDKVITTVTANSASFAAPGIADGAATGTIISRVAPAGWQELFAGSMSNVLVLKPTAVEATGCVLRVDDTGTVSSRLRAYESMASVSAGAGPTPLDSQVFGGLHWVKSSSANSDARPWFLIADGRAFYFAVAPDAADRYTLLFAGDDASFKSPDAYNFLLTGNESNQPLNAVPDGCCGYSHRNNRGGAYYVRSYTGIGQSIAVRRIGSHHNGTTSDTYAGTPGYSWGSYPNGANNGLMTGTVELMETACRGTLPGLLHPTQDMGGAFSSGTIVDGTSDYVGRRFLTLRVGSPIPGGAAGTAMLDITDWGR